MLFHNRAHPLAPLQMETIFFFHVFIPSVQDIKVLLQKSKLIGKTVIFPNLFHFAKYQIICNSKDSRRHTGEGKECILSLQPCLSCERYSLYWRTVKLKVLTFTTVTQERSQKQKKNNHIYQFLNYLFIFTKPGKLRFVTQSPSYSFTHSFCLKTQKQSSILKTL